MNLYPTPPAAKENLLVPVTIHPAFSPSSHIAAAYATSLARTTNFFQNLLFYISRLIISLNQTIDFLPSQSPPPSRREHFLATSCINTQHQISPPQLSDLDTLRHVIFSTPPTRLPATQEAASHQQLLHQLHASDVLSPHHVQSV